MAAWADRAMALPKAPMGSNGVQVCGRGQRIDTAIVVAFMEGNNGSTSAVHADCGQQASALLGSVTIGEEGYMSLPFASNLHDS